MTTPLGGTRSEAIWFNQVGQPCGPEEATSGEIREFDSDGLELGRTYVDRTWSDEVGPGQESDPSNEALFPESNDLLKMGTWDIWVLAGGKKVETLAELLEVQGFTDRPLAEQRQEVAHLMALPMWVPAPEQLKTEALAWLATTIQE